MNIGYTDFVTSGCAGMVKTDFKPLLPSGLHRMHLCELRTLCVDTFPLSLTRARIMNGLEGMIQLLESRAIKGDVLVNGGFMTRKIDPEDVDIVLRMQHEFIVRATPQQKDVISWFSGSPLKQTWFKCDQYLLRQFPKSHRQYAFGEDERRYWSKWFTTGHDGKKRKGAARIDLRGSIPMKATETSMRTDYSRQISPIHSWGRS